MEETLGEKIKRLRKQLGISQQSLAHNICTQSEISRIESNKHEPSYLLLVKISERFGVNVDYFLKQDAHSRDDYINEVKNQLQVARRNRNYSDIEEIIKIEMKNPIFKEPKHRKFLLWHKGIVQYHLYEDSEAAITTLTSCISDPYDKVYSRLDIHILNSIGIIYRNEKQLTEAKTYLEKAHALIDVIPQSKEERIELKVLYNLSKVYTDISDEQKSLELCFKGLTICKKREDMFLFSEFHYQIGRNYLKLGDFEHGLEYWQKAMIILEFDGKTHLAELIKKEMMNFKKANILS